MDAVAARLMRQWNNMNKFKTLHSRTTANSQPMHVALVQTARWRRCGEGESQRRALQRRLRQAPKKVVDNTTIAHTFVQYSQYQNKMRRDGHILLDCSTILKCTPRTFSAFALESSLILDHIMRRFAPESNHRKQVASSSAVHTLTRFGRCYESHIRKSLAGTPPNAERREHLRRDFDVETKANVATAKRELLDSVMAVNFTRQIPHSIPSTSSSCKWAPQKRQTRWTDDLR